jgi:hypothetical protein
MRDIQKEYLRALVQRMHDERARRERSLKENGGKIEPLPEGHNWGKGWLVKP